MWGKRGGGEALQVNTSPPWPMLQEQLDTQPEENDDEDEKNNEDVLEKEESATEVKESRSKKPFYYLLPSEGWKAGDRPGKPLGLAAC